MVKIIEKKMWGKDWTSHAYTIAPLTVLAAETAKEWQLYANTMGQQYGITLSPHPEWDYSQDRPIEMYLGDRIAERLEAQKKPIDYLAINREASDGSY